jgi:nucleoside-diphosphate-sugar epimerase
VSRIAVVTGGTGFIGWNLCERLRDQGVEVRAVVRPSSSNPLPDGITRVDASLRAEEMSSACEGAEAVFHLAGLTRAASYEEFRRVNAGGARQAALAARSAGAFLVFVSSMAAGGSGTADRPRRETDPDEPVSLYGRSKLAGEREIAGIEGLRYAIVRPPGVYGPRDKDFLTLFTMAKRGLFPMLGNPDVAYTLVHVNDVNTALLRVAEAGAARDAAAEQQTFYVGHPEPLFQGDFPDLLGEILNRRVRRVPVPRTFLKALSELGELGAMFGRPAVINRSRYRELTAPGFVCSVEKLEERLGVVAEVDVERGFAETAGWYREMGWM